MRDAYVKTLVEIQDDVRVLIGNLEKTLEETKTALFTQNLDKARIMRKDLTVQVLQSPVASDWRSLMGTFRVLSELERIADHCSDMALYIARILERNPVVKPPEGFKEMYEDMQSLLEESFRCYLEGDDEKARYIGDKDDIVDADFERLLPRLTDAIKDDPADVASYVDYVLLLKYMERTADHGTNIGNWVLYMKKNLLKGDNGFTMD